MGCSNCGPNGCGNKGHCSTGGCNRMNTYDWISTLEINDPDLYNFIEVSFKNGARKEFYKCKNRIHEYTTGDMVVVECSPGYDVGQITLMGELVRLQMKKKKVYEDRVHNKIVRKANERDLEKIKEARILEKRALAQARAISRTLSLDMKLGDIEYQGDLKKATFYYTANGRIDFRQLVKEYAKAFKVKVEMRQIGSRQESARIGGIGSCGRELCCSTWLSDFKSVNTSAARYQNISINQTKLTGQCGRLKCCLNYELDTYMDALKDFPKKADSLLTKKGKASLIKTDIFKGLMYYSYDDIMLRGAFHPLDKDKVKEILAMNAKGEKPEDLLSFHSQNFAPSLEEEIGFADDVTGVIELPAEKKRRGKKKRSGRNNRKGSSNRSRGSSSNSNQKQNSSDRQEQSKDNNQNKGNKRPNKNKQQGGPKREHNSNSNSSNANQKNGDSKPRSNRNNKNRNRNRNKNKSQDNNGPKKDN